jgi:hypothetical protein
MKRTCIALLLVALGCVGCCGTGGKCWNASEKPEAKGEAKAAEPAEVVDPCHPFRTKAWLKSLEDPNIAPERVHGGIY